MSLPHPPPPTNANPPPSAPPPRGHDVFVRQVGAANLAAEVATIRSLLPRYPYVTVHAEFLDGGGGCRDGLPPGVREDDLPAAARYALAKIDVDTHPVRQLGITLCDAAGRLPALPGPRGGGHARCVWQFAFRHEPSPSSCPSSSAAAGTTLTDFGAPLLLSGVVSPDAWGKVRWVAFGGLRGFGFILRALTNGAPLPETVDGFLLLLRVYLGENTLDVRHVAARLPAGLGLTLTGSLPCLAALLDVPAAAATELAQAGEKSLAACQVLMRIKGLFFAWYSIEVHAGRIHGLH